MKKKASIGIVILILLGVSCLIYIKWNSVPRINVAVQQIENESTDINRIYTKEYQADRKEQVEHLKASSEYSLTSPLVIDNPYGTMNFSLYVYYKSNEACKVEYTVSAWGCKDFTKVVYQNSGDNRTKEHEFSLMGLVADKKNTITLRELAEDGNLLNEVRFTYKAGSIVNEANTVQGKVTGGESKQELTDGMYALFNSYTCENLSIPLYDNYGTLRCELLLNKYKGDRLLVTEEGIYFANAANQVSLMDSMGRIVKQYDLGIYDMHHDIIWGQNEDMIILATQKGYELKEDRILSMDMKTGKVKEIVNLEKLFPDYLAQLREQEGVKKLEDWMHINSIDFIGDGTVILSSRETSTLIAIKDIYTNPSVDYIIGSKQYWGGTGYEQYVLEAEGEFAMATGQHSITYSKEESMKDGEYDLFMFNNNYLVCDTRPTYDWDADMSYDGVKEDKKNSYYYRYRVDETAGTYSLVEKFPVKRSSYVSNAQHYDGNIIMCSGYNFLVYEFDSEGKEIQKIEFTGEKLIYRGMKYSFKNFWFA